MSGRSSTGDWRVQQARIDLITRLSEISRVQGTPLGESIGYVKVLKKWRLEHSDCTYSSPLDGEDVQAEVTALSHYALIVIRVTSCDM